MTNMRYTLVVTYKDGHTETHPFQRWEDLTLYVQEALVAGLMERYSFYGVAGHKEAA